jgi:hypothetical protein
MSNKTINQALKDLFLGLGGESSALADNSSVSDYIEDLESAIKGAASAELPTVTSDDNGKILAVANGEWTLGTLTASANLETGAVTFTFTPDTPAT